MRFIPNRLMVEVHERVPVAFARVGSKILLIDAGGTLMELPAGSKSKYSFPVILGMNPGEPLSTRAPRMQVYNRLVADLDAGGAHYSQDLSEVDLSDLEDVKVLTSDPDGEVLIHLGSANYLDRYRIYVTRVKSWRQQFDKLESVDLRYERQIIVNPDLHGAARTPALSATAAKAAMAAGVKPAALITHIPVGAKAQAAPAMPTAATKKSAKFPGKAVAKKTAKQATPRRTAKKHTVAARAPEHVKLRAASTEPAAPAKPTAASSSKKPSPAIAKIQGQQ